MAEGLKPTDKDLLPPKALGLSEGSTDLLPPSDVEETFVPAALQAIEAGGAAQLGALGQIGLGFKATALAGGLRRGQDERIAAQETLDETNPDATQIERIGAGIGGALKGIVGLSHDSGEVWTTKEDDVEGLIEGIPRSMHRDIMDAPTEEAAIRARARILEDLDDQMITSQQYEGGGLRLISSFLDVDAPLTIMSGGMIGAAKIARAAALVTKNKRIQGALQLGAGGAQAGAIVGAYDVAVRETSDESTFIASTIGGMAFGGTIGTLTGPMAKSINDLEIDYAQRVETSDPSLVATGEVPDVVTSTVAPPSAAGPQSVGAAQSADAAPAFQTTKVEDPHGEASPTTQGWHDLAETSNYEAGFDVRKREDADKKWTKALTSEWNVAVGGGFQAKMYTSKSAVMNWMGRTVYESASGLNRGSATSAAMMEIYHKKIAMQLLPVRQAMHDWAQTTNNGAFGSKYGISYAGKAQYNREVMLERNARQRKGSNGGPSTRVDVDQNITRGADAYDSAARDSLAIGKGRDGEHSVMGMEDVADNIHYTPQNWSGSKIANLIRNGRVRRENVIAALAESYREAGMAVGKDADAVAEAVIRRSQTKDAQIDTSVHSLLQADGQEFLRDSLGTSGMSKVEIDGLMKRLVGAQKERGKEGFAKSRNEVDMATSILTEDGSTVQIVDLLSNDLAGDWQRYARRMAGSAALARQGITSRGARKEITSAIHAEQRAAGEELTDPREIEAMFTNFDGGAVKGFNKLEGGEIASAGPAVALAKRGVQLAWLNQLGLTQLGETGALLWQNGLMTSLNRSGLNFLRGELKAGNKALLDDIKFLTGEIGQDQHLFAEHLNLDEVDAGDRSDLVTKLQSGTSNMAFVQGYTSLFNSVRAIQQKTAALGTTDKIMRTLREELQTGELMPQKTKDRMWSEFGLDQHTLDRLSAKIEDGTIEFSPEGFVNRLNADKWDGDLQDIVGAGITRNINQLIQKSMAGEQDAWMHTGFGAVLSHLKTFPLQATHKQLARHFRHNDPEAYGALAAGMITAGAVSVIRGALNGDLEELTTADHAKRAFAYSNMTGFIPMTTDPLTTMLGLDDLRFNQYSKHSEIAPPILSWANDAIRLPGALKAAATGTANYDDRKALRTLPFANTLLIGEMFTTAGQATK